MKSCLCQKKIFCCDDVCFNSQQSSKAPETIPVTVSKSFRGLIIRKGLQVGLDNIKQARLLLDKKLARKLQVI